MPIKSSRVQVRVLPILLLAALCLPLNVLGLNLERSIFQYNCQTWRRHNGLVANAVNAIAQTSDGYIWLGTPVGLVRFDGMEFKLLDMTGLPDLRDTVVTSFSRSRQGGLWFGLQHGAFGYCDGKTVSLRGREEWGGLNMRVHSILETPDGDLWIAAEILAARLRSNVFEAVLSSSNTQHYDVSAIYRDSTGRIWLGTAHHGLYFWSNGALEKFHDDAFDELTIRAIVEDAAGRFWFGTEWGLLCYDQQFRKQDFPYPWYPVQSLLVDRHGAMWVGTIGGGLVRLLNGREEQFRQTDGLADDIVTSLAEDEEGNLWVGTRNGLSQFSDVMIPTMEKSAGLTADVNVSVCASQRGGLWIATSHGLAYFDGWAHTYTNDVGLHDIYINSVFEAANGDVYLVNGHRDIEILSNGRIVANHTNAAWPTAFAEDAGGVVVAIGGNLFRVGTNYFTPLVFTNGSLPLSWVFSMTPSRDGSVWLAGDEGICRIRDDSFELWTRTNGLPDSKVRAICEDADGIVWAGTETGLVRLKDGRVRTILQTNGLFDNIINAIVPDDHGNLWVDSNRGFFSVSRRGLNDFADGKTARVECVAYTGTDAVKSSEKFQQQLSGCKTLDGCVWFPTAQGVVMINPTNLHSSSVPPKVHIQSVRANGRPLNIDEPASVPPGAGDLEFQYAGLSYIAPLKIQYRYMLDGYDKDWVEAGNRRAAFYTNLKPGQYRFHVQARKDEGDWISAQNSFVVALRPHFYQTAWFRAACILSGIALLASLYAWWLKRLQWRQEQLKKSRELLEARVEARTAELKQEIEERKRMQREVERVHRQLVDASRQAGQAEVASSVLHNVGNVLNSVNVSAALVTDRLRLLRLKNIERAAALLEERQPDLAAFLTQDERGRKLPDYLKQLSRHLAQEQSVLLEELKHLSDNVEHIKEIVAMQQSYAKVSGVVEQVAPTELVESALKMHAGAYQRHGVAVVRDYEKVPVISVDRHKVLQILVNVFHNAKYACEETAPGEKKVWVRIKAASDNRVSFAIQDSGVGIPRENLTRIFSHGFTTRKNGHGFGLHSAALAAGEMGGTLTAQSDGPGKGATFTLELPLRPKGETEFHTRPGFGQPTQE